MQLIRGISLLMFSILFPEEVILLDNGLAKTPPMGWMSWGYYMCGDKCKAKPEKCLNEELILSVVDSFFEDGYQEAGYEYIIIDDCWSEKKRNEDGKLVANKERFPRGMKFIADYIHARGLKFGMYTNIAEKTCMMYPGSRNFFEIDAQTFAQWDIDYLKVDGCFVEEKYLNTAYIDLGKALNSTGRKIVYSCSWPYYSKYIHFKEPNYTTIAQHCNLWRNYHDVYLSWSAIKRIIMHYVDEYRKIHMYHKPGQWNDPDMLILGTGVLTDGEMRAHIAAYAMMSAPLLLSCNMKHVTPYERQLLQNMEIIAIAQDPLGIMAQPKEVSDSAILYVKKHLPMKGDEYSYSICLVNLGEENVWIFVTPEEHGMKSPDGYTLMDVFTKTYLKNVSASDSISMSVERRDAVLYSLFPL